MSTENSPNASGLKQRTKLLVYSRPFFRTWEIICNHAARMVEKKGSLSLPAHRAEMAELNRRRAQYQRVLRRLGDSHGGVCADCKGRCCHGPRERDAFTDRVMQDPETPHRAARREKAYNTSEMICPNLTEQGCRLPHEERPVQCAAYFCQAAAKSLSSSQCETGAKAISALMGVQLRVVRLALKSRN